MSKVDEIKRKLEILGVTVPATVFAEKGVKSRESRKEFWSRMMDTAERDGDRLKASELLGRSEADFVDTTRHVGGDGGPIQVQPMNLKGLHEAIDTEQSKSRLRLTSN